MSTPALQDVRFGVAVSRSCLFFPTAVSHAHYLWLRGTTYRCGGLTRTAVTRSAPSRGCRLRGVTTHGTLLDLTDAHAHLPHRFFCSGILDDI